MNHDLETLAQTAASWQPGPLGTMREVGDLMAWAADEMKRLQQNVAFQITNRDAALSREREANRDWITAAREWKKENERLQTQYDDSLDLIRHDTTIIKQLRAIVEKVPQTTDSVAIPVGEIVYAWHGGQIYRWKIIRHDISGLCWLIRCDGDTNTHEDICTRIFYSTREAAEKAKETP